jgi:hypothetical protein
MDDEAEQTDTFRSFMVMPTKFQCTNCGADASAKVTIEEK